MRRLILLLLMLATFSTAASADERRAIFEGRRGLVWLPDTIAPAPLILFSHGFGGCPAQTRYLTQGLADAGYVVAAPEHSDHACGWPGRPEKPFREPENWTPDVFKGRRDDLRATLAALRADPDLSARIDWDKVGIMGHSLGGYAGLGMVGAIPGWETPGIDAVLVMSPYCTPFIYRGGLDRVQVPVLYQGGSRDRPVTPTVTRPGGCFDLTPSPAWYVEIRGAWHLSWTGLATSPTVRAAILASARDFFDSTLKGIGRVQRRPGFSGLLTK
jgi:predicted dienelactone hydrolase